MANFIDDCLRNCVRHNGAGEALVYGTRRISWRELDERASRLASALAALGVGKGDRVVIMLHNRPEFWEANYAVQKLGAIPVPMNYRFAPREIAYQANHCGAHVFIYESLWQEAVAGARQQMGEIRHYLCVREAPVECTQSLDYEHLIAGADTDYPQGETAPEDTAVLCYTGGTTGLPKGVMLTYQNHLAMLHALVENLVGRLGSLQLAPELEGHLRGRVPGVALRLVNARATRWLLGRRALQRALIGAAKGQIGKPLAVRLASRNPTKAMMPSFPMFHDAAYQLAVLGPLLGNLTLVMPDKVSFDPDAVLQLVERERPLLLGNVPTAWRMLVEHPGIERYDVSSVLVCATGAGVCPAPLKRRIFERFPGVVIADGFGQTEMTPVTSFRFDTSPATLKDHCVGRPVVATRIVDEQGQDVPAGEIGEIIYHGGSVMKGYYNEPDKTAETVREGWLHSGDLGFFDADGDLHIVERKKECISSGGEKIFPHEIEEILLEHPDIQNVCVIGVPDEKWGQSVRAIVQPRAGARLDEAAIMQFCEGRMAGYKKPRSVVFTDALPISPVGKVQRRLVKEAHGQPTSTAVGA